MAAYLVNQMHRRKTTEKCDKNVKLCGHHFRSAWRLANIWQVYMSTSLLVSVTYDYLLRPFSTLTHKPLSHWPKKPLKPANIWFCLQYKCVKSAFTPGSNDSAVDAGFNWLHLQLEFMWMSDLGKHTNLHNDQCLHAWSHWTSCQMCSYSILVFVNLDMFWSMTLCRPLRLHRWRMPQLYNIFYN